MLKSSFAPDHWHRASYIGLFQVWKVYGQRRVGMFALKEIKKDTELTINYALSHGMSRVACLYYLAL